MDHHFSHDDIIKEKQMGKLSEKHSLSQSTNQPNKENGKDRKMKMLFENNLIFPYPESPFAFLFDKFHVKPDGSIKNFPRLTKVLYNCLKYYAGRTIFNESIAFSLIQEMILHPKEADEIGSTLIRYCKNIPNYQIDLQIWMNFCYEISVCYPYLLIYILAILRPKIFKQEFSENYSNEEIIILLLTSLLCKDVIENEKVVYIQSALALYFEKSISPFVFDVFQTILEYVEPELLIPFPSFLPSNGNTTNILKLMSFIIISRLIGIDETYDLNILIENLDKLQKLSDPNDSEKEIRASIIITYLEKLCSSLIMLSEITVEQLESIKRSLTFQKHFQIDELFLIREKLHITRSQIDFFISLLSSR